MIEQAKMNGIKRPFGGNCRRWMRGLSSVVVGAAFFALGSPGSFSCRGHLGIAKTIAEDNPGDPGVPVW